MDKPNYEFADRKPKVETDWDSIIGIAMLVVAAAIFVIFANVY